MVAFNRRLLGGKCAIGRCVLKIMVTGDRGYIGAVLVPLLEAKAMRLLVMIVGTLKEIYLKNLIKIILR